MGCDGRSSRGGSALYGGICPDRTLALVLGARLHAQLAIWVCAASVWLARASRAVRPGHPTTADSHDGDADSTGLRTVAADAHSGRYAEWGPGLPDLSRGRAALCPVARAGQSLVAGGLLWGADPRRTAGLSAGHGPADAARAAAADGGHYGPVAGGAGRRAQAGRRSRGPLGGLAACRTVRHAGGDGAGRLRGLVGAARGRIQAAARLVSLSGRPEPR